MDNGILYHTLQVQERDTVRHIYVTVILVVEETLLIFLPSLDGWKAVEFFRPKRGKNSQISIIERLPIRKLPPFHE